MIMRIIIIFAFLFSVLSLRADKLPLYHLSMLFPLPEEDRAELPGLKLGGCSQSIFDKQMYLEMPRLLLTPQTHEDEYESQRLVGMRWDLDENEVRLIFQPLREGDSRRTHAPWIAEDAALHLFFKAPNLLRDHAIKRELRRLNDLSSNLSYSKLGLHPAFESSLDVKEKLSSLLCRIAGWGLYKATFMTERRGRVMWHFGGFKIEGAPANRKLGPELALVNLNQRFQDDNNEVSTSIQRMVRGPNRLRAAVFPQAQQGDHLNELFNEGKTAFQTEGVAKMRKRIDRIENPKLNNPSTVDCVSCHAVESARRVSTREYGAVASEDAMVLPLEYELDRSIPDFAMDNTINLRSFGYYDSDPVISRRVLLESYLFQQAF